VGAPPPWVLTLEGAPFLEMGGVGAQGPHAAPLLRIHSVLFPRRAHADDASASEHAHAPSHAMHAAPPPLRWEHAAACDAGAAAVSDADAARFEDESDDALSAGDGLDDDADADDDAAAQWALPGVTFEPSPVRRPALTVQLL
jgi:hypothetical protein